MNKYKCELERYAQLNSIASRHSVVLFGSTFAKNIPVSELSQTFNLNCDIYNRSFTELTLSNASKLVEKAVMSIQPKKILIQLGNEDLKQGKSVAEIITSYEKLIKEIKVLDKKVKIVVVSELSNDSECDELNKAMEAIARKLKCQYADITDSFKNDTTYICAFNMLRFFILDRLTFSDVMSLS